jgi:ribosome modulation factor
MELCAKLAPKDTSTQMKNAWKKGFTAKIEGKTKMDSPYKQGGMMGSYARRWLQGWKAAEEVIDAE